MTLQLIHSEFPYIWGKFDFLFYQMYSSSKPYDTVACHPVILKFQLHAFWSVVELRSIYITHSTFKNGRTVSLVKSASRDSVARFFTSSLSVINLSLDPPPHPPPKISFAHFRFFGKLSKALWVVNIFVRIFEKLEMALIGKLRGQRKMLQEKPKIQISFRCYFNCKVQ